MRTMGGALAGPASGALWLPATAERPGGGGAVTDAIEYLCDRKAVHGYTAKRLHGYSAKRLLITPETLRLQYPRLE